MSEENPIRLLVTHVWVEDDDYHRLFEYLNEVDNFFYVNLSDPLETPPAGRLAVEQRLSAGFEKAEILIVLASVWQAQPASVDLQIALARRHRVPALALRASGNQTFPRELESQVDDVVIWNERLIVDAILRLARGDRTNRFETIDFP